MPRMLCRDVAAHTTDYLEGALSDEMRHEFESHTEACRDCARYVAQICITIRLLASIEPTPATTRSLAD